MSDRILCYPVTVCANCLRASCWLGLYFCFTVHKRNVDEVLRDARAAA